MLTVIEGLMGWLGTATGLEFGFMQRAALGCVLLALGAAPVGVFLMLRRMSLMGDAMSHAILPGAAIGYWLAGLSLPAMTAGGIAGGLAVAAAARRGRGATAPPRQWAWLTHRGRAGFRWSPRLVHGLDLRS